MKPSTTATHRLPVHDQYLIVHILQSIDKILKQGVSTQKATDRKVAV